MTTYIEESLEFLHRVATQEGHEQGDQPGRAEGIEQGHAQGIEQGHAEGVEHGLLEAQRQNLRLMASTRFGELSPQSEERINAATNEDLDRWTTAMATASSLDEVLDH